MEEFTPALKSPPQLPEEDIVDDFGTIKKQLIFGDGEVESSSPQGQETSTRTQPSQKQSVLTYLRVRPKSQLEVQNQDSDCLHQLSEHELLAVPPKASKTYKSMRALSGSQQKFSFSKIFSPSTTQKELFDETLRPLLKDFFEGQNCLVFTYGVTNSG